MYLTGMKVESVYHNVFGEINKIRLVRYGAKTVMVHVDKVKTEGNLLI